MKENYLEKKMKENMSMTTLPSADEIRLLEIYCEKERNDAIFSVLVSPFTAVQQLFNYTGDLGKHTQEVAGVSMR